MLKRIIKSTALKIKTILWRLTQIKYKSDPTILFWNNTITNTHILIFHVHTYTTDVGCLKAECLVIHGMFTESKNQISAYYMAYLSASYNKFIVPKIASFFTRRKVLYIVITAQAESITNAGKEISPMILSFVKTFQIFGNAILQI